MALTDEDRIFIAQHARSIQMEIYAGTIALGVPISAALILAPDWRTMIGYALGAGMFGLLVRYAETAWERRRINRWVEKREMR